MRDLTISAHFHPNVYPKSVKFLYDQAIEILCFVRATEISLSISGIQVRLSHEAAITGGGEFTRLTKLQMCEFRVTDGGDGISELVSRRCPCLEVLELERIEGVEALTLITDSLQRLRLIKFKTFLEQLQVKARNLRKMQVLHCFACSGWW
ncbi:hypothetical protein GUJ93_ZPchr0007g3546 [Zizania palustris]|uniref:Uncharacterized protein n=1 Tax=Zizania palustris TaxID=103762 RepID=A0A8J5TEA1_ZIZPA|nr:hypothetical protein GUJ93_ZPchr0007g3546 [Zizania palustris]